MRFSFAVSVMVMVIAASGCNKRVEEVTMQEPVGAVTPTPLSPTTSTPGDAAREHSVSISKTTPQPNNFAPDGVYFLTAAVSLETDGGIVGLRPGTKVLKQPDGKFRTSANDLVSLGDDQITNDSRIADRVANAEASAQSAIRKSAAARQSAPRAPAPEVEVSLPLAPSSAGQSVPQRTASATPKPPTGGLQSSSGVGATHSSTKDKVYIDSGGQRYWKDVYGRARYDF